MRERGKNFFLDNKGRGRGGERRSERRERMGEGRWMRVGEGREREGGRFLFLFFLSFSVEIYSRRFCRPGKCNVLY